MALTNLVPVERVKELKRAYGTSFTAVILVPIATFLCLLLLGGLPRFVVQLLARNLVTTALISIIPGPDFSEKLMGNDDEAHSRHGQSSLILG